MKNLLKVTAVMNVLIIALHLYFPSLLNWSTELVKMDADNQAVYLTMHYILMMVFVMAAYVGFFRAKQAPFEAGYQPFLFLIAALYFFRSVAEFVIFEFNGLESISLVMFCMVLVVCYGIVIAHNLKKNPKENKTAPA